MEKHRNLCTESGCHAGCCRNTVMRGLDPEKIYPWLQELPAFKAISSPEQLQAIQKQIDNPKEQRIGEGVFVISTNKGVEVYIIGLCPSNSGAPEFDCRARHRPSSCKKLKFDRFSCAAQRTSS